MPAKSKAQFRLMQMIKHGGHPRVGGPSREVAREFVSATRSPGSLPERKKKEKK